MISAQSTSKLMYTLWNLAMLYIMEPDVPPLIGFGASHDVIDDITHDIIGIE